MSHILNFLGHYLWIYLITQAIVLVVLYRFSSRLRLHPYMLFGYTFLLETFYMLARLFFTLDLAGWISGIASVVLWLAEFWGYLQQGVFYISMGKRKRSPHYFDPNYMPAVDFMIPTFSEPFEVLNRTFAACNYLDYPKDRLRIYVLDDGGRDWVRKLTERYGFVYLAREDHSNAKAGNLNYALSQSNGELIVTIDADMVPKSFFLKRTVGYFAARKVAFVQAPQIFFNPDPFQHNLQSTDHVTNEQDFFMTEMEEAKDKFDAVMYVGSNAVFSREALQSIGGFAVGSITEDVATGMLLQAKGYRSVFVKEILAKGLSAESFSEMLYQRDRWARGNIQAAKLWDPLTIRGLTIMQRILYANGVQYWFFGIQKLVYILSPILFLDFHVRTLNATVGLLLMIWLPKWMGSSLSFRVVSQNKRTTFWSHVYETAMAPYLAWSAILATLGLERKKKKFRVTNKGLHTERTQIVWNAFIPHGILFLLSVYGLSVFGVHLLYYRNDLWFYLIIYFWSIFNLVGIIMSMFISIEQPRPRKSERVPIEIPCTLWVGGHGFHGKTTDISETGAKILLEYFEIPNGGEFKLELQGIEMPPIPVSVLKNDWQSEQVEFHKHLIFSPLSAEQYMQIVKLIFDQPETLDDKRYQSSKSGMLLTFKRAGLAKTKVLTDSMTHKSNSM